MAINLAVFSQSNYNLRFEEKEFSFTETKSGYEISCKNADYYLLGDTTLPALPYKNCYILVPENVEIDNVNVNFKSKEVLQNVYIVNNPVAKQISQMGTNSNKSVVYSKSKYPDKNIEYATTIKTQGFYMAAFSVCPFIYNTQKKTLEFISEMSVSFNQNSKNTTSSNTERYDMEDLVKSLIINPEEIDALYPQRQTEPTRGANDVEYLIITSENLKTNFNTLKAWKIRKGIKTEIITTDYIYNNYVGATNQLKIKKCLQDYYLNKNLKWVLLGGDNTIVPVQSCYAKYGTNIDYTMPCDLFYACFDNTFNWDANNNGIIGETNDNIDMSPEIYISRVPIRTVEHINAIVNKTIAYETNPSISNYVKTMLLTGASIDKSETNKIGESDAHWNNEEMYVSS